MITIHLVFNAHLDPIWLWSYRDGIDEVLNTSSYVCDLLDRHPDLTFTRGEGWLYEQIKKIDPVLFRRIVRHVKAGRWHTVGGWYIQPDCNLPSGFALERQIALGAERFREYFGRVPKVAYNVDSFGHAATLPGYIRGAGQKYYVFMRPQEHELQLPARLFRWRGYVGGPEVTTFRIPQCYCSGNAPGEENFLDEKFVQASLTELPQGVQHTMCFVGIGDHGGGPTEEMVKWCRANRDIIPGARMIFSSPEQFFAAIERDKPKMPTVTGELQMHAIGCYSVHRQVKTLLRRTEHGLMQTETILRGKKLSGEDRSQLKLAWERASFHQFHDTICGTCVPTAYEQVHAEIGQAMAIADNLSAYALRQRVARFASDPAQRIVLLNASEKAFDDYIENEPYFDWTTWKSDWRLVDEKNKVVPCQAMISESAFENQSRLLFPLALKPSEMKILRVVKASGPAPVPAGAVVAEGKSLSTPRGPSLNLESGEMKFPGASGLTLPELVLYTDDSDTWSHHLDRFPQKGREVGAWGPAEVYDKGPLMGSLFQRGTVGVSPFQAEWRIYRDKPWIDCLLRVIWMEQQRVLKLEWKIPGTVADREDGIMGGTLHRPPNGREHPVRDWTRLRVKQKGGTSDMAIVSPEVYSLDVESDRIRLTLLRAVMMACHTEEQPILPRSVFSDRGEHWFRLRFWAGKRITTAQLDDVAMAMQRPPLTTCTTRGMKTRYLRGTYVPSVTVK